MRRHSSERKFRCSICDSGFKTKQGLQYHSRSTAIYKCFACDAKFPCKLLLSRHRIELHGNDELKCDKCPYQTKLKQRFLLHELTTHDKPFTCSTCQKKFSVELSLKRHQIQQQHGTYAAAALEEVLDCFKFDKAFPTPDYLKRHQRRFHKETEAIGEVRDKKGVTMRQHSERHAKVECSTCKKMIEKHQIFLQTAAESPSNQREFHGNVGNMFMFKCDKCSYQTKRKRDLIKHIGTHDKSIACESCLKKFSTNYLKVHQQQHRHGIYATTHEETFDCNKCCKSFSHQKYLKQHQRIVQKEKESKCEVCNKIYKNRCALLNHHRRSHIEVKCSIRPKIIAESSMADQLRSRIFELKRCDFRCDFCDQTTVTKGHLERHMKRMHSNDSYASDSYEI